LDSAAVRPTLVNTIAALQKQDVKGAKAAFEAFDSGWNGIEVYISTRSTDLYNDLEHNFQSRITEGLNAPSPNTAALLSDAQAMLAKYDEAIGMVAKASPLNRLYDDVARLRIERAHLREVNPALKAGISPRRAGPSPPSMTTGTTSKTSSNRGPAMPMTPSRRG